MLNSFRRDAVAAVIGASGGIGEALCRAIAESGRFSVVHALSRSPTNLDAEQVLAGSIDISDAASVAAAAERVAASGALDLVVVATGILHDDELQPERALREIDGQNMEEVFRINTIGPAVVAKHFLPLMNREDKSVFGAISARVGSIEDNRKGGWVSYRASKAALNMVIKTLSIEHARRYRNGVVVALHPGTVATNLSAPFRSRVPEDSLFTPQVSAGHLLRVIDGLSPADSGGLFAWDGSRITY